MTITYPPIDVTQFNDDGFLYIKGDADTDGSIRFSEDASKKIGIIEKRINGVWNLSSFKAGGKSFNIGERVAVAAGGHHLITEDSATDSFHFHAHLDFDGELSETDAKILNAYKFTQREIFQPDNSGSITTTAFEFILPSTRHTLTRIGYFQTSTLAASQPIRIRVWEGNDDTGILNFDQTYPTSLFPASSEIILDFDGYLEFDKGINYFFRLESDENFSIKTNIAETFPWIAADTSDVREDDMIQTNKWESGNNFIKGVWSIQNNKIYELNVTGIQTGTFNENIDKWDKLSPENFSYDNIEESKEVRIPTNQQMTVHGDLTMDGNILAEGNLIIEA